METFIPFLVGVAFGLLVVFGYERVNDKGLFTEDD